MTTHLDPNTLTHLADLCTAHNKALRDRDAIRTLDLASQIRNACEIFRRQHCPDAHRVYASCDRAEGRPLRIHAHYADPIRVVPVYDESAVGAAS